MRHADETGGNPEGKKRHERYEDNIRTDLDRNAVLTLWTGLNWHRRGSSDGLF
jgi:hypothetical protein